jgi:hypothetical protein
MSSKDVLKLMKDKEIEFVDFRFLMVHLLQVGKQ